MNRMSPCALLLIVLVLVACGPTSTEAPAPTEAPPAAKAPTPTATPAPVRAQSISEDQPLVSTYIMRQGFFDLDPAYAYAAENTVLNLCYENLLWYSPPGSDDVLRPGLATGWQSNEDATVWTFELREGVTFQDGTPFDARAVKFTIERYLELGGQGCTWIWDAVDSVEVIDDYTVGMNLSYPAPIDLIAASAYCGQIMSPSISGQPKEWFDAGHCAGTGPYTIESRAIGQRLVMTRFEEYWGGWRDDQFDKIVFEIVHDAAVASQMIEMGDADFLHHVQPDKVAALDAKESLAAYVQPDFQNMMLLLNTKKAPLDDRLVRQALAYSFPYDQTIERTEGLYTQARGAIPAGMWGHGQQLFQYWYDLDRARDLLVEAGYPDGGFDLEVTYVDVPGEVWAIELWAFPLAELGIELKPQIMTFDSLWELAKSADPSSAQDVAVFLWWATYVDPYDWLQSLFHCEEEPLFNLTYWCNEEYDALIDEAHIVSGWDRSTAEAQYIAAQEILLDQSPALFLFDMPSIWVVSSDIDGFVVNPAYQGVVFYHDLTTSR